MPRNKKRNASNARPSAMKKSNEKELPGGSHDSVRRDEIPSTSTQSVQESGKNEEYSVREALSSGALKFGKRFDEERSSITLKKKRKSFNLMKYFSDSDDDEPEANTLTMRYVDVARSAMSSSGAKTDESSKKQNKELNIALEEFPLLPPCRYTAETIVNTICDEDDDIVNSDISPQGSIDDGDGGDVDVDVGLGINIDHSNEYSLVDGIIEDDQPPELIDNQVLELDASADNLPETTDADTDSFESESSVCFDLDNIGSSASSWEIGSTDTSTGNETAACTDDGGGDANNSIDISIDCNQVSSQELVNSDLMPSSSQSPDGQQNSAAFSQEWLERTVRRLAADLRVTVPAFNFTEPNIDFARGERHFDDPNYLRMEDRALFALRLTQNKSFFGKGKYM